MKVEYDRSLTPSAPSIGVVIADGYGRSVPQRGKLDTGADITAIPEFAMKDLDLDPIGEIRMRGVFGEMTVSSYAAVIIAGGVEFDPVKVVPLPRSNVLVGRNLINECLLTLDGRREVGEMVP